jgi:hypothetical protein
LPDRQALWAVDDTSRDELLTWLNAVPELAGVVAGRAIRHAQQNMADLARYGLVSHADEDTLVLYSDDRGWVFGNPRRSYGYVYVTAFLRDHVPAGTTVAASSGRHAADLLKRYEEQRTKTASRRRR